MADSPLTPVTWSRLTDELAERIAAIKPADGGGWARVGVDGAPAAGTGRLADAVAQALPALGRAALRVRSAGFLRPASLRFEYGRRDPDAYYDLWLDEGAVWREVFAPLDPGGDGRVLPSLWDPATDRATRADYVRLPPGGVLLLDGPFLLGRGFPLDLGVHLRLSAGALARRTPGEEHWTLPAFGRYEQEVRPDRIADVLVRCDDPKRPAWTG
jgi:hypothetical protein